MSKLDDLHTLVRLLREFELPVSPILEYAIKEKMEQLSSDNGDYGEIPCTEVNEDESMMPASLQSVVRGRKKRSTLRITRSDGTIIECQKVADTLCQAIREIGPQKVYDLKIPIDGMYLVTMGGNPLYPSAQHDVGDGLFVNVHSNTVTKKRQLEKIFMSLDLDWKVEIM